MPSIVVVGPANVGKSTLTNRMLGYAASIVADLPGTTRDWVGGMAQLRGVAVRWLDTPGIRSSEDAIEQHAITLAQQVIHQADVLIHMTDMLHGFDAVGLAGRQPDLHVLNKADQLDAGSRENLPPQILPISASTGMGVAQLIENILQHLGLHHIDASVKWAFSPRLKQMVQAADRESLCAYMAC
jgi:tRNA modification GTPase